VTTEIDKAFDTGSAALGAGGSAGILLLSAAGGLVIFRRRHHEVEPQHDISFTG
jgi:LPXTG-motif cell wall-anchored protein